MNRFIIDVDRLHDNLEKIRNRIHVDKFFYSLKANADPIILNELQKYGCYFEIASVNEFEKVISVGAQSKDVICGLPIKPLDLLQTLGQKQLEYFVFEDYEEYKKIKKYADKNKKVLRIYVGDIDKESFAWGAKMDELENEGIYNQAFWEDVDGFTFHISRNYQIRKMEKVFERIEFLLGKYASDKKMIVNIGGGIRGELPMHLALKYDLDSYYEKVNEMIHRLKKNYDITMYCEPGRGVVESACHIVTSVEYAGEKDGKYTVFVDLNIGIPVGAIPYRIAVIQEDSEEEIYNIQNRLGKKECVQTTFGDTVCERETFFALPLKRKLNLGEKIIMYGMGAYTTVRSNAFHSRDYLSSVIMKD